MQMPLATWKQIGPGYKHDVSSLLTSGTIMENAEKEHVLIIRKAKLSRKPFPPMHSLPLSLFFLKKQA